jgi:hypothetical protein
MVKMDMSDLAACIHNGKSVVVYFNNIGIVRKETTGKAKT